MKLNLQQNIFLNQGLFLSQGMNFSLFLLNSSSKNVHLALLEASEKNPYLKMGYSSRNRFYYPTEKTFEEEKSPIKGISQVSFLEQLQDSLLWQNWTGFKKWIAEVIASSVKDLGKISVPLEDIARYCDTSLKNVEKIFSEIRSYFPYIHELQEDFLENYLSHTLKNQADRVIVKEYLFQVEKQESLTEEQRINLLKEIIFEHNPQKNEKKADAQINFLLGILRQALNIFQQSQLVEQSPIDYLRPDIVVDVDRKNMQINVQVYDEYLPDISINTEVLINNTVQANQLKKEAQNTIDAFYKRQSSLNILAQLIIKKQRDFFFEGEGALEPLSMKEIASKMEVSPSTITRLVHNKTVFLEGKLIPLRDFFVPAVKGLKKNYSRTKVLQMISDIRKLESQYGKITDEKIQHILKAKGVNISRRTVNKYKNLKKL